MKEDKQPFTEDEERVMDFLVKAHNEFIGLEVQNENDNIDWMNAFHQLQNVLINRVVRRDYPKYFR